MNVIIFDFNIYLNRNNNAYFETFHFNNLQFNINVIHNDVHDLSNITNQTITNNATDINEFNTENMIRSTTQDAIEEFIIEDQLTEHVQNNLRYYMEDKLLILIF